MTASHDTLGMMMIDPSEADTQEKMQRWAIWHQAEVDGKWESQFRANSRNHSDHEIIMERLDTIERKLIRWMAFFSGAAGAAGYFIGGKWGF